MKRAKLLNEIGEIEGRLLQEAYVKGPFKKPKHGDRQAMSYCLKHGLICRVVSKNHGRLFALTLKGMDILELLGMPQ